MEYDKKDMTLDEAIAIIKEIEPRHERTNSETAETLILQAVHTADVVPVVRCRDCFAYDADEESCSILQAKTGDGFFCAYGQRRAQ